MRTSLSLLCVQFCFDAIGDFARDGAGHSHVFHESPLPCIFKEHLHPEHGRHHADLAIVAFFHNHELKRIRGSVGQSGTFEAVAIVIIAGADDLE